MLRSHRLVAVLSAGALAVGLASLPRADAVPGPTTVLAAPRIVPAVPLPGEHFDVTGRLTTTGVRTVVLQRRSPSAPTWTDVQRGRTTSAGRYTFDVRTTAPRLALRVLAPAAAGKKALRTPAVLVQPKKEVTSLSMAGNRLDLSVTTTLTPVRVGRPVRLQVNRQGGWKTIASRTQSAATMTWPIADPGGAPRPYRVVAGVWNGAPIYRGVPVALTPGAVDTGLPRIALTTQDAAPIVSKDDYVNGTLQLGDAAPVTMQIKGRGHGSWVLPKKPYRIKLTTKQQLLDLPAEKDWVLLANFADRSLLRTYAAFTVARSTSLAWTPQVRFVDVTLNGVDIGSYVLTEQVEAEAARVALAPDGLLLEVDTRYAALGDPGFTSTYGTPLGFKDPDDPTTEQQAAVLASVDAFESALYGPDFLDPVTGYAPYVDLDSFADWYLVNEFMKNLDGDFFSSTFVSWDPAGTFTMGPVWDFDLSSGYASQTGASCCGATSGWWLRGGDATGRNPIHATHWLSRMTQDPAFLALLSQRWTDVVGPAAAAMIASLPTKQAEIEQSAALDWTNWRIDYPKPGGTVHAEDQPGEVAFLTSWLTQRHAWMDAELS